MPTGHYVRVKGIHGRHKVGEGGYGTIQPHLRATVSPTTLDIAWAAGIFEGEGNCRATHTSRGFSCEVSAQQKFPWILHKMRDFFGGRVTLMKNRSIYTWAIAGVNARGFLMTVYTFLSPVRRLQTWRALWPDLIEDRLDE